MAISLDINTQIVEIIYLYLSAIDVGVAWDFEFLPKKAPAIAFKQVSVMRKTREYITGGYVAELPFNLFYKGPVKDTRSALDMTLPLNALASYFEAQKDLGFPGLTMPEGYEVINLEMISTPEDASGNENNEAVYTASYVFEFRKKSKLA